MNSAIRTENLSKRFRKVDALNGLNFDIAEGAIYALVGPNGAGKTTTIKILMNIFQATGGAAEILGIDSRKIAARTLASIGYVSENQELPLWMTVTGFLGYLRPFYPTWDRKLEDELIQRFELPLERKLKDLSRGMRMKATLAGSLAYHPKVIILDEPFSGLDPLVRDQLIEGLLERASESTTLVSSHDLAEIESFASHVAAFFEHVRATPVQAHISFALSTFQNGETKRIVATSGEFKVPGLGFCSIVQGYAADSLRCRYAFVTPTVLTTVSSSEMPCPFTADGPAPPGLISRDWSGSSASDPVSPIGTLDIYFWKWEGNTDNKSSPSVCPGTSLIFRTQEPGPQIRKEIEIDGIKLADYQTSNVVRLSFGR